MCQIGALEQLETIGNVGRFGPGLDKEIEIPPFIAFQFSLISTGLSTS
jgi:hypothetical protein